MTTFTLAKYVSAVGGALLVSWQLAGQFDTALQKHLTETFATKADFQRLEEKLDQVLIQRAAPHPSKK